MKKKFLSFIFLAFIPFTSELTTACGVDSIYIVNPCEDGSTFYVKKSSLIDNFLTISPYSDNFATDPSSFDPWFDTVVITDNSTGKASYTAGIDATETKPIGKLNIKLATTDKPDNNSSEDWFLYNKRPNTGREDTIIFWFTLYITFSEDISSNLGQSSLTVTMLESYDNSSIGSISFKLDYSKYK